MKKQTLDRLKWIRAQEARMSDIQVATMRRIFNHLAAADEDVTRYVSSFMRKWSGRPWHKIPLDDIDRLLVKCRKSMAAYSTEAEFLVSQTANARIAALGEYAAAYGLKSGQYNVTKTYLRFTRDYTLDLFDRDTRLAVDQIRQTLVDAWRTGGIEPTDVIKKIRGHIGCDADLRKRYNKAVRDSRGMTAKARNKFIKAQMKRQRGLAYKSERIVRSEAAKVNEEIYQDWVKHEIGDDAIGERFQPESDACDICLALEGDYPVGQGPKPVTDTHPNCNCDKYPLIAGIDDPPEMRAAVHTANPKQYVGEPMAAIRIHT